MSTTPPAGPKGPGEHPEPIKPSSKAPSMPDKIPGGKRMLDSPFAKMFERTGGKVSAKEMHAILNGILMRVIDQMKKQDAEWKKAMKKLKKQLEGNE